MNNYGEIATQPDKLGQAGRAWRIPMAAVGARGNPDSDGTVDGWVVNIPGAHPAWSYWVISAIHLRPIPGVKPAHISFEGATHEILIASVDPGVPLPSLESVGNGAASFAFLTPIDFAGQVTLRNDADAMLLCELVVGACVDGVASPDQDWRAWWKVAVTQTASHIASNAHAEARLQ